MFVVLDLVFPGFQCQKPAFQQFELFLVRPKVPDTLANNNTPHQLESSYVHVCQLPKRTLDWLNFFENKNLACPTVTLTVATSKGEGLKLC